MNIQNLRPAPPGKGGKRAGAGRKPLPATQLKERLADYADDSLRAFKFCVAMMDDESVENALRLSAAREVMDRLWGKPKQQLEHSGEVQGRLIIVRANNEG